LYFIKIVLRNKKKDQGNTELQQIAKIVFMKRKRPVCRVCPVDCKKQAAYPDQHGNQNQLCAKHARLLGSHQVLNPCRDCPVDCKKQSNYPDEHGNKKKLCAKHARLLGSHQVLNPCRDCPVDCKKQASYPDEHGDRNQLCAKHARLLGSHQVRNPCRDCPVDCKKQACYPDKHGNPDKLCAKHARLLGSHQVQNPCRDCPVDCKKQSKYPDEHGNERILCAEHSYLVGAAPKPISGCSIEACCVWDRLERELNIKLQHRHFVAHQELPTGSEFKIPGTNYKADAYCAETGDIYEYHGNTWHGFPPNHPDFFGFSKRTGRTNQSLYMETMARMDKIKELHPDRNLYYIWSHEITKNVFQSVMSSLHLHKPSAK
jgi:hypothetical protein